MHAALAARARARGDAAGYAAHVRAAMRRIPRLGSDIRQVEPVSGTRGGFFSCLATTRSGERLFVKCILPRSREAMFWRAWRAGLVRTEGALYRLLIPDLILPGTFTTFLVFPEHRALPLTVKNRVKAYRDHAELAIRVLADFNSDHMARETLVAFRASTGGALARPPRASELVAVHGLDSETARATVKKLRAARAAWRSVTARLQATPVCLCHLDFGRGNVVFEDGKATMIDFGHAAIAPAGADLHTVLRFAPTGPLDDAGKTRLARIYATEFHRKGVTLDPNAARLAMEAHFAARYSDPRLRSARQRGQFMRAVDTAATLAGAAG